MIKHTHLILDHDVRLHLRLLAAVHEKNVSQMVTDLVENAYSQDQSEITKKAKTKMRRIIKQNIG
jgi:hypothetical protein